MVHSLLRCVPATHSRVYFQGCISLNPQLGFPSATVTRPPD